MKSTKNKSTKQAKKVPIPKTKKGEIQWRKTVYTEQGFLKPEVKSNPAFLELERQKKLKTKPAESTPSTPQNMADQFRNYAKTITETANKFSYQQHDPELARLYIIYRVVIENMVRLTKKYLNKDLPELSALPGNDYFAGTISLADWCIKCAAILTTKIKDTGSKPKTKLSAEIKLTGVLAIYAKENPDKRPTITLMARVAGVSRKTANGANYFRATLDKLYSEDHKKGSRYPLDDNRLDLSSRDPEPKD